MDAVASAAPVAATASAASPPKPGYTAIVPITPFGAAPPPQQTAPNPAPASQPVPEPITFTVRLPTIVMLEPKP